MSEIQVNLSFTVSPATQPLVANVLPPPSMTVGVAVPNTNVASISGGVAPYSASLDPSSAPVPPGITLSLDDTGTNIQISGTPTAAGTFGGVVVDVTDSAGTSAKLHFGK